MSGTTGVYNLPVRTDLVANGQQVEQHPALPEAHCTEHQESVELSMSIPDFHCHRPCDR